MKSKKTILIVASVVALVLIVGAGFMVSIRYARMQENIRSEFYRERPLQPGEQPVNPRPTPKPGVASNPVMQMFHDMVGVPTPDFAPH